MFHERRYWSVDPDESIEIQCSSYYTNNVSPLMMGWTETRPGMAVEIQTYLK